LFYDFIANILTDFVVVVFLTTRDLLN